MIERIRSIIVRFPENEEAVRELIRDDRDFDALCQEYADIGKEIEDLAKLGSPMVDKLTGRDHWISVVATAPAGDTR